MVTSQSEESGRELHLKCTSNPFSQLCKARKASIAVLSIFQNHLVTFHNLKNQAENVSFSVLENFLSHFCKKTSTAFLSILHKLEPFRCYKFHNLKNLGQRVSLAFSLQEIVSQNCAGQESFNCLVVHRPEPFCYLKNLAESFTLRGAQFLPGAERCTVRRQLL